MVKQLNRRLRGWSNYFCLGPVSKSYRRLERYTTMRVRQWLCKKHKVRGNGYSRYPDESLYRTLGLIRLPLLPQRLPWAKACSFVREPDAGDPHVRFDERGVETRAGLGQ